MSDSTKLEGQEPKEKESTEKELPSAERRTFLGGVLGVTAATVVPSVVGTSILFKPGTATATEIGPLTGNARQNAVYEFRKDRAHFWKNQPLPSHPDNGDDNLYPNKIGSYSKGFPHNNLGEVDVAAYATYINALQTGNPATFEAIPHPGNLTQRNPQAAYAFDLLGNDSHAHALPAAPTFASAETAGEMVELYWQALTRDVLFSDYATHPLTIQAAQNLSQLSDFRGPKQGGVVTAGTLFRGGIPGDLTGPYISQFLLQPISYGPMPISHRIQTGMPNIDHVTSYSTWLAQQNGTVGGTPAFDPVFRYLRNGRDLAEYVGRDVMYQPYVDALLILNRFYRAPFSPTNPYNNSETQHGHGTFGAHNMLDLIARAASIGQKAAWFHKWLVHRRLRPDAFAGRIHNHVTGAASYPIHADVLNSPVLNQVFAKQGTYMLSQVFPVGVPPHPAYPAGHATIAGACVTILKAFFDESFVLPNPIVASSDGTTLVPYTGGGALTVGGELNKLASNISIGRDTAGVHWRTDSIDGMNLGEAVAITVLQDVRNAYNENFAGFTFTKFDGTTITI